MAFLVQEQGLVAGQSGAVSPTHATMLQSREDEGKRAKSGCVPRRWAIGARTHPTPSSTALMWEAKKAPQQPDAFRERGSPTTRRARARARELPRTGVSRYLPCRLARSHSALLAGGISMHSLGHASSCEAYLHVLCDVGREFKLGLPTESVRFNPSRQ